jgi:predicted ATPase/DNA-binding SARP family transcriptional activator
VDRAYSDSMEFQILGPLSVLERSQPISIPGERLRTLLGLLLIRAGEATSGERLAEDLWGNAQPSTPANSVQSLISRLRTALGSAAPLLVTAPTGYRLDADPSDIDAVRFTVAVDRGRAALAAGDLLAASRSFKAALELWRGPALAGIDGEGALRHEALRLEALKLDALEQRCDVELRLGRNLEMLTELGTLVAAHPLRERLHALYMLALYRTGRQGEALRAYQSARTALAEELGLDPGPELKALEASVIAQDPSLLLDAREVPPSAVPRRFLPTGLSTFIGRTEERRSLEAAVGRHRLVTIVGPGGAGKTRVALEVCGRPGTADYLWFVDLAPVVDPGVVAEVVADAVGANDDGLVAAQSTALTAQRIAEHIGCRRVELLLDNCEHVVGEAARLVEQLLRACPQLTIVVTSREALNIPGEQIWPIPPLALRDAVALFADRASASGVAPATPVDDDDVAELCARLDGLPLAIELAASRTRVIPFPQLAARLDERFRMLTGGARTAMPRHQTLRAVVDWSYDLLFDDERRIFERLSVFSGGCSLEAAEVVCAGDDIATDDVADLLFHLVDKSLVTTDRATRDARFRLLQTLALYGRERLAEGGQADETRRRHCRYFAALCARGQAAFRGEDQAAWLREVNREADNIRGALAWSIEQNDAATAVSMAGGLGWSWWITGRTGEGCRWLDAALACRGYAPPRARALAKTWACVVSSFTESHIGSAFGNLEEAIALWREADDTVGLADATALLAEAESSAHSSTRALSLYDEAHALYARGTDPWSRARAALCAGRAAHLRGELDDADRFAAVWKAHVESAGVIWGLTTVRADTRAFAEIRGDLGVDVAETKRALAAARQLALSGPEPFLIARLGHLAVLDGDIRGAEHRYAEALARAEELGNWTCIPLVLNGRAIARKVAGRLDDAVADASEAARLYERAASARGVILSYATLGFVAQRQRRWMDAADFHSLCATYARDMGHGPSIALTLEGLAGPECERGRAQHAATLLGAAHRQRADAGGVPPGPESDVEQITARVRAALGEPKYAEAFEVGRRSALADLEPPLR